ncbi:MAG: hypothetical protein FXF47_04645 [Candidatus Mcinerneyibacterium aminivorans]|uniref:FecR protein domain-containing protein n=1 Tax=Candidatus Mcinerneyibacterium aminivorans TaxID=2703815 RepID=A0A5D0MIG6_9BACT|nr:MAG: hypothetical protein FXF47_04645 [Candidatus Mcinerneyibacterium aminivorans]
MLIYINRGGKMRFKSIFCLGIFYIFFIISASAQNVEHVAKIDFISGDVVVYQDNSWKEVRLNQKLYEGDLIETKKNSYVEILSTDKNIKIEVEEKTRIEIKEFKKEKKTIKSFFGKLWNKIKSTVGQRYEVETRFGRAGVRGTEFAVTMDPEKGMDVICEEGEIYLKNISGNEQIVKAGFKSGIDKKGKLLKVEKWEKRKRMKDSLKSKKRDEIENNIKTIENSLNQLEKKYSKKEFEKMNELFQKTNKLIKKFNFEIAKWEDINKRVEKFLREYNKRKKYNLNDRLKYYWTKIKFWKGKIKDEKNIANINYLENDLNSFYVFYKISKKDLEGILNDSEYGESIHRSELKKIKDEIDNLYNKYLKLKELIRLEKNSFKIFSNFEHKIFSFRRNLYNILIEVGSIEQWLDEVKRILATGEIPADYKLQARKLYRLIQNYRNLRSNYSNYKRMIMEIEQKDLFIKSKRLMRKKERIERLLKSFRFISGNDNVSLHFDRLHKKFMPLIMFFNSSEGKELLS